MSAAAASLALAAAAAALLACARAGAPMPPSPVRRPPRRGRVAGRLAPLLARAGIEVDPARVPPACALASALLALAVHGVTGSVPLAAVAAAVPPAGLALHVRGAIRRRPARVAAQLPVLARRLADGLRAGLSLRQSLVRAAPDLPSGIGVEVVQVAADLEHGARAEDALEALTVRVPHPDVEVTVCAILVTLRTGGDLSRILTQLADDLEDRRRLAAELATATSQARMTAWLVAALPLLAGVGLELFAPGTLARTLGEGLGLVAVMLSMTLFVIALVLVRRLSQVAP
ncbi:MAG TPA: type II secretion system F family protein [Miltoncostaeaceae bacterium]|nr:type II secretion system F family protein [Miltoncostaeaceae bacterium]